MVIVDRIKVLFNPNIYFPHCLQKLPFVLDLLNFSQKFSFEKNESLSFIIHVLRTAVLDVKLAVDFFRWIDYSATFHLDLTVA